MTYAELTALMQDYLENQETSFVNNIPAIVRTAESAIYKAVRTPDQRQTAAGTVSTGTFTSPAAFEEALGLFLNNGPGLLLKAPSYIRTVYGGLTGEPKVYAILTSTADSPNATSPSTILLGPTPNTTYNYVLDYLAQATSITVAASPSRSTWLSINYPDVLLYRCLIEGYVYNKGAADMMAEYKALFQDALQKLKDSAEGTLLQDEYSSRPVGREVTN